MATTGGEEWERARALVLAHGWNAMAYQLLNPGLRYWFSAAGDAVAGYVTHAGVRVVAGAPVCAAERLAAVAAELETEAHAAHERVCYFGAGDRLERVEVATGRHAMVLLGAQPVWDPAGWPAIPKGRASLRAQLNRARNKGVRVVEWPGARAERHPELRRVLGEWLATRHLPPLHFMVEPETLGHLRDRRVFVAERALPAGESVVGFLVASPVPARGGWLVEQIVRGREAPNGTAELMVDAAMRALGEGGAAYVTLGLAPLSQRAGLTYAGDPLWLRLILRWVRAHGRRFYNFDGLDAFKAKLAPHGWEPIFAIGEGRRFPPRALWAIAGAFSRGSPIALVLRATLMAVRTEVRTLLARRRRTSR